MEKKVDLKIVFFWISISLFIILSILVFTGITHPIDMGVQSFIISIRNNTLTNIFKIITNLGGAYALIAIVTLLFLVKRRKKNSLLIMANLILVFITSQMFKFIFRRERPLDIFLVNAIGYSYPSGHTLVSSAFYFYILYLINKHIKNRIIKVILFMMTTLLVMLIGFSRIYLGIHYTTDVIGGLFLACACLMLYIKVVNDFLGENKQ